jgi:hypothetical protein
VSTKSPNRDANQRPALTARSLFLRNARAQTIGNRKRTLQRRLCCACFCSSDRTSSSCSANASRQHHSRSELEAPKTPRARGRRGVKLNRTLSVHGDEVVGFIVPAVTPPPPPPSRHRLIASAAGSVRTRRKPSRARSSVGYGVYTKRTNVLISFTRNRLIFGVFGWGNFFPRS